MRRFIRHELFRLPLGDRSQYIPPRGEWHFPFTVPPCDFPATCRLRLLGETDYFWRWRTEWGATYAISMGVDDALTREGVAGEAYALRWPCRGDRRPCNAYLKFYREELSPGKTCRLSQWVTGEEFRCGEGTGLALELYWQKEGRHPHDVFDSPDQVVFLPYPEGSYGWQEVSTEFPMPENVACAILRMGVVEARGALKTGSPRLAPEGGENVAPPLAPTQSRRTRFNYLGENLSRRDWLECTLRVDGREIFRGEKYSSIVRRPEYTFEAGPLAPGKHLLTLTLEDDYDTAVGFVPQGLELHLLGNHDFELIGAPETVPKGEPFAALLRTTRPHVVVTTGEGRQMDFPQPGLHAFPFPPLEAQRQDIQLSSPEHQDSFTVERTEHSSPHICLGTGDAVYIPMEREDMERYLEWYVANHIGNCLCFRHSYRWGGGRGLHQEVWRTLVPLLNQLRIHYTLMVDGREVPGMTANPPEELLQGPFYLGRRAHENDGSLCYWDNKIWGTDEVPEPYGDILSRGVNPGGIQPHVRPKRREGKTWWFFDPEKCRDMKEAAQYFVENLKEAKGDSTRHSGPSTLFRYFFQAGYDCLLAEQMYGPEEVVLSSLRGASRAYGRQNFGTHLAVQWGSTPLDCREHGERLFLSLATSYLQGATEINVEEGLWRMENGYVDYDRFSHACQLHQEAFHRFRTFLEHHPRRGRLVTPAACLQGRYDGWRCFDSGKNVWCHHGEEWKPGLPEESFQLTKVFFPRARLDAVHVSQCDSSPKGWYTGTPYGPVDLLPWEGDWSPYRAVALLGWHTYRPGDGEKMLRYVRQGGTLLLGKRHLNTALGRLEPLTLPPQEEALETLLGKEWRTATGLRERQEGQGRVLYFPSPEWPAHPEVLPAYGQALQRLARECALAEERQGWIRANEDVEFAAYEQEDGHRCFYLLNIRWWDRRSARATLVQGSTERTVEVPFGEILVLECPPPPRG